MASRPPSQHRALVLESIKVGFQLRTVQTPEPIVGSAIVHVLEVGILSYMREVYNGQRQYPYPMPMVGGCSAIARVAGLGPDAVALKVGQLVYGDCVIRGRDDPSILFLSAINEGYSDGSKKLMRDVWRDGTFAEFAKDLIYICYLVVPYEGLRDIKLEPGETIIVCPATGGYGGAGVQVAIAMGARVIAMGRNETELARMKKHVKKGTPGASIETVKMTGDESIDTAALKAFGIVDAVLDLSPPAAANSTHLKSAINSLRKGGRCSLMGSRRYTTGDWSFIGGDITLKSKLMYERKDMLLFVKMLERGLFPKGKEFVNAKAFSLGELKEASEAAAEYTGIDKIVVLER